MQINCEEWLEIARKEYLHDFIRCGGSAVKFLVPSIETDHKEIGQELRRIAEAEDYCFASVDAARTPMHLIHEVFHEVARQVDWDHLAFSFFHRITAESGYKVPPLAEECTLAKMAELNEREPAQLQNELNGLLEKRLYRDYQMCHEFRIAMIHLCRSHLSSDEPLQVQSKAIKEWLRGELRHISNLKSARVYQKIVRHNARHMFSSLSHWVKIAGRTGIVILLDISRCSAQRPKPKDPYDDSRYYTRATTLDVYEVLRQFVDATDELEYCFICVMTPPAFLDPGDRRSVWTYDALKQRVWDEVRDKYRVNPLSSLLRISSEAQRGAGLSSQEQSQ